MRAKRIFWKLFPSYIIITLLCLVAVFVYMSSTLGRFFEKQTSEQLEVRASLMETHLHGSFLAENTSDLARVVQRFSEQTSSRVTLVNGEGAVLAESDKDPEQMGNHRARPEILGALAGKPSTSIRFSNTLKKKMMYVAVPVMQNGQTLGVVRVATPLTVMEEVSRVAQRQLFWVGLLVMLAAAIFSLVISRRISYPIELIKEGAERLAQGDLSHRLYACGSAETSALAESMNMMAAQLEERLELVINERNQREAVLSSMVEGVVAVDQRGHIISMNSAAARFFHVMHPKTAHGRSIEEVFRNVKLQAFIGQVLVSDEPLECELTVQDRETFYLQARGTTLFGGQPQSMRLGAVVVFNDVSRLRRLENLRSDFVANVSHELKTPITAIKGFVETLLDGAMKEPEEGERFLSIVAKHADRLNAIIDDLLTLSRLEQSGGAEMEIQTVGLGGLMNSAVEVCSHRASKKAIQVEVECEENLQADVNPPLIEQALINLISNAIKYSEQGKTVRISAFVEDDQVVLSVQDAGYGIEPEHLDRLFERFYRVDKGRSRQEGGTGLGLAIVKHIAQVHRGRVSVESTFAAGSTFSICLPR